MFTVEISGTVSADMTVLPPWSVKFTMGSSRPAVPGVSRLCRTDMLSSVITGGSYISSRNSGANCPRVSSTRMPVPSRRTPPSRIHCIRARVCSTDSLDIRKELTTMTSSMSSLPRSTGNCSG